jgi:superfamily II DNA/RNA helicase
VTSFDALSLRRETRAALSAMAVSIPTPIQVVALPEMLAGRDVIGQARTGSGKTLAFALPIVERVDERRREVQALVLAPTRELAAQVAGVVRSLGAGRELLTQLLVGGMAVGPQTQALRRGVHVVVGTPGRVLDHIRQGNLRLDRLRVLVLDEADETLDRGFAPDVERIIATTNPGRQTALFSATMPDWVGTVASRHLREPASARVDVQAQPVQHVPHAVYDVPSGGKLAALRTLLDARGPDSLLVFGRTKHGVRKLAKQLDRLGYPVAALQGNLSQNARDRVMADFRSGATPILIATNVAARGLDVDHVAQVINYELPETADLLTHRVGRTGRMGRAGEAITLLTPEDETAWKKLLRELRRPPVRRPWRGRHEVGDRPAVRAAAPALSRAAPPDHGDLRPVAPTPHGQGSHTRHSVHVSTPSGTVSAAHAPPASAGRRRRRPRRRAAARPHTIAARPR